MHVISGTTSSLPESLLAEISRYRHKVFIETLGWELPCADGIEQDQFDRADTVYVVTQDDERHINGCARLLPTDRPYLLADVFPQLLNGMAPPCSPDIWELSRFAAVDFQAQGNAASGQFSSPVAVRLLQESIACAARHGVRRLITVSPMGIERLLRRAGFHAHRAGPPTIVGNHALFACWIEVVDHVAFEVQEPPARRQAALHI
jgi:N-acyl-L-homoserine lactone synthetase